MKKLKIFGLLLCGLLMSLTISCEKDEEIAQQAATKVMSTYSFGVDGINADNFGTGKANKLALSPDHDLEYVRVTILDAATGDVVSPYNNRRINIDQDANGVCQTIPFNLSNGSYKLTQFDVYDSSNQRVYVAPQEFNTDEWDLRSTTLYPYYLKTTVSKETATAAPIPLV